MRSRIASRRDVALGIVVASSGMLPGTYWLEAATTPVSVGASVGAGGFSVRRSIWCCGARGLAAEALAVQQAGAALRPLPGPGRQGRGARGRTRALDPGDAARSAPEQGRVGDHRAAVTQGHGTHHAIPSLRFQGCAGELAAGARSLAATAISAPGATSTSGPTGSTSHRGWTTTGSASSSSSVPTRTAARSCLRSRTVTGRARPPSRACWPCPFQGSDDWPRRHAQVA